MSRNINEDLEKFKTLLGYDPKKGSSSLTEVRRHKYTMNEYGDYSDYADEDENPEEEETGEETGGAAEEENTDFDFGDTGNPEDAGTEDAGTEETTDEFGTADEFSAADELEDEESDVEEIDVTSIVNKSDEAREMAQQAVSVGQENTSYLKALTDKLSNLESQLTKMDSIASKITKLEQDIKTPEEKLELRSLDSYPFNMKLSDYWEEKANSNPHYRVSTGEESIDGQQKEYVITPEMVDDFNDVEIKKTFVPESYNRKKKF